MEPSWNPPDPDSEIDHLRVVLDTVDVLMALAVEQAPDFVADNEGVVRLLHVEAFAARLARATRG